MLLYSRTFSWGGKKIFIFLGFFSSFVAVDFTNHSTLAKWCRDYDIKLVVVGPEDPLANGRSPFEDDGRRIEIIRVSETLWMCHRSGRRSQNSRNKMFWTN